MRAGGAWLCGWLLALAGCLESHAVVCGDGRICPAGLVCSDGNQRCVTQGQIDACAGLEEAAPCQVGSGSGECHAGACLFATCGNGVVEGSETCDGPNLGEDTDCVDLGYYDSQPLQCTDRCQLDDKVCTGGRCGDGDVNGPELCDGHAPEIQCVHLGYDVGALPSCTARCAPDTALCHRIGLDQLPVPAGEPLQALTGSGPDDVYGIAEVKGSLYGTLFHHDGTLWRSALTNVYSVWSAGPDDVYVTAKDDGGIVLQHFDGSSWSTIPGISPDAYQRVRASGPDDIDVLGSVSMHWDGQSWRPIDELPETQVLDLAVDSTGTIHAVMSDPPGNDLFRFAGDGWERVEPGISSVSAVWSSGPDDIWVGGFGDLAHWDGRTWSTWIDALPVPGLVQALAGTASDDVYLIVSERIDVEGTQLEIGHLLQYDGVSWTVLGDLPGVHDVWAGSREAVYLAGEAGSTFRYRGSLWRPEIHLDLDAGHIPAGFVMVGDDVYAAINFSAFNVTGDVHHYDAASGAWQPPVNVSGDALSGLFGDDGGIYAVGAGGLYRMDGPDSWAREEVSAVSEPVLDAGWADGTGARFVVGSRLARDLGGGWVETALPSSLCGEGLMHAVWGSSASDVFAVGDCGGIVHFDGSKWDEMDSTTRAHLRGVWGRGPDDVYAVGDESAVLHWDGSEWRDMAPLPFATGLRGVWGTDHELFATGGQALVFHFDGVNWSLLQPDTIIDAMVGLAGRGHDIAFMAAFGTDVVFLRLLRTVDWRAP